jgi:hypothetical protein
MIHTPTVTRKLSGVFVRFSCAASNDALVVQAGLSNVSDVSKENDQYFRINNLDKKTSTSVKQLGSVSN